MQVPASEAPGDRGTAGRRAARGGRSRRRARTGSVRCRIDARSGGVERQLADRYPHPSGPLVSEAQDAFVVGDDDQADVVAGRAKDVVDPTDVVGRDPDAARTPEDVAELLAREADRRCVDDRQELLEIVDEEAVEQVSRSGRGVRRGRYSVQGHRPCAGHAPGLATCSSSVATPGGSRPWRPEGVPLTGGEGRALVEKWLCEKRVTATRHDEVTG